MMWQRLATLPKVVNDNLSQALIHELKGLINLQPPSQSLGHKGGHAELLVGVVGSDDGLVELVGRGE